MTVFYCQTRTVRHCVLRINVYIFYVFIVGLSNSYHMSEVFTACSADVEILGDIYCHNSNNYRNTKLKA